MLWFRLVRFDSILNTGWASIGLTRLFGLDQLAAGPQCLPKWCPDPAKIRCITQPLRRPSWCIRIRALFWSPGPPHWPLWSPPAPPKKYAEKKKTSLLLAPECVHHGVARQNVPNHKPFRANSAFLLVFYACCQASSGIYEFQRPINLLILQTLMPLKA